MKCLFVDTEEKSWSMVGMDADRVRSFTEPTMQLNLGGHSPEVQESIVVKCFGHALGLEHEHQRSDFWSVLEKHLDVERIKAKPQVAAAFMDHSKEQGSSEYDPDSIMHYP